MNNIKLLVVDDDEVTRHCLKHYFIEAGYSIHEASTAEKAEKLLAEQEYDLLLLDIRLPGKDGLTLTRELRVKSDIGIILVTGCLDEVDCLIGLECGADDYITKPFNPREILARSKSILRRVTQLKEYSSERNHQNNTEYHFDNWSLNTIKKVIINSQGELISLTATEYRLLHTFIINANHTMSRDQLMDKIRNRVWNPVDRTIDVMVGKLRRKLGDNPTKPHIIITAHGEGYVFTAKLH